MARSPGPAERRAPVVDGRYLRAVRLARGWTQQQLAAKVDLTQGAISQIELGRNRNSQHILLIMYVLGLPVDPQAAQMIAAGLQARADEPGSGRVSGARTSEESPRWPLASLASAARAAVETPSIAANDAAQLVQGEITIDGAQVGQAETEAETEASRAARDERLATDYEFFAAEALRIRVKRGAIEPLIFNRAQRHIHAALETQKARTGKVRALILKGRQQGCSTYVGGRYYHRASHHRGLKVFILTHEEQATKNLFEMVERFHDHCAQAPSTSVANASELRFDELDSGYKIGTAGTKGIGRSATVQLFHGSEVAFWPFAQSHAAGVLQAVAEEPGTEVILESTANGVGNLFHSMWRDAESGASDYIAVFVPWFWQEEYRKPLPTGFLLTAEEHDYAALYELDIEQMAWRRSKIAELKDASLFAQEYPATAAEAFQMSGHDSFIPPALIARARKAVCEESGPLVIGYDPAWLGEDRHTMAWRRGRRVLKVESRMKLDTVEAAGWLKQVIDRDRPVKVFIDVGGVGAGVYDQLRHMGEPYSEIVEAVNFGSPPFEPTPLDEQGRPSGGPLNRRAEVWGKSKEWLELPGGVQIPDSDSLQADACGPTYRYDSLTRLALERKEDMRRRGLRSPDEWDAVALTFAKPVAAAAPPKPSNFHRKLVYPRMGIA
jgi:transcriptional regulator with XRE-family HTH domain